MFFRFFLFLSILKSHTLKISQSFTKKMRMHNHNLCETTLCCHLFIEQKIATVMLNAIHYPRKVRDFFNIVA